MVRHSKHNKCKAASKENQLEAPHDAAQDNEQQAEQQPEHPIANQGSQAPEQQCLNLLRAQLQKLC